MPVITNKIRKPRLLPIMAKALGVNLEQAILTKRIENFQRHDVAYKCSECREKIACEAWLTIRDSGDMEAPVYCPNKALLEELRN